MAAPEACGLFHRAIARSGYLITQPELRNGYWAGWPDADTLGVSLAGCPRGCTRMRVS